MRLIKEILVIIHTLMMVALGTLLLSASIQLITIQDVSNTVGLIYQSVNNRLLTGGIGTCLILVGLIYAQYAISKLKKVTALTFSNTEGETTISLNALENLVKQSAFIQESVKDPKVTVTVLGKKLIIKLKLHFISNFPIQEFTQLLQTEVKTKLQKLLGSDQKILVKIHITKIEKNDHQSASDFQEDRRIPFPEYSEE